MNRMGFRQSFGLLIAFLVVQIFFASTVDAVSSTGTVIAGKVVRKGFAVVNFQVTLFRPSDQVRSSPVYTDNDGFYYFRGVPPGAYVIEIWGKDDSQDEPIVARSIRVLDEPRIVVETIVIP